MAIINPFNGRKDLKITFYGENENMIAMFRVVAIDFKSPEMLKFLEKYVDHNPFENGSMTNFQREIEESFKKLGALTCQSFDDPINEGIIKQCKYDIIKDW